jgi:hypothetical protein
MKLEGVTLSKAQRLQVLALVTTLAVMDMYGQEVWLGRNAKDVQRRIRNQAQLLLEDVPAYGEKTLRQLTRGINLVWNEQENKSYTALTLLNMCLALVEDVRWAMRAAGKPARDYALWTRLAGSMFTLVKHTGPQWEMPGDSSQVEAMELWKKVQRYA